MDHEELEVIAKAMRRLGVLKYKRGDLEVVLGPPPDEPQESSAPAEKPKANPFRHVMRGATK